MVLGDFNAHLGGEAVGEQNLQGAILQNVYPGPDAIAP